MNEVIALIDDFEVIFLGLNIKVPKRIHKR